MYTGTPKPKMRSKTIIFNVLVVVGAALTGIMDVEFLQQYSGLIGAAVGGINIVLRMLTTQPVE